MNKQPLSHCEWAWSPCHCSLGSWILEVPRKGMVGQELTAQGSHQAGSTLASRLSSTCSANAESCQGPDAREEKQEVKMEASGVEM